MSRKPQPDPIVVIVQALHAAEDAMTKCPAFNPWDLGPLAPLPQLREAIAVADVLLSKAFERHRRRDPHCTCNDCIEWASRESEQ